MAHKTHFRLTRLITLMVITLILLTSLVAAQEAEQTHTVAAGETLAGIAAEYDITLDSLLDVNDIEDPDLILVGLELVIPAEAAPLGEAETDVESMDAEDAEETEVSPALLTDRTMLADGDVYIVEPGDVLDLIAQDLDISLLAIAYANDMTPPYPLLAGQVLIIPTEPPYGVVPPAPGMSDGLADGQGGGGMLDGQIHVIQPGDILDSLAQTYDVSLDTLLTVNDISDPAGIMPGLIVVIPNDAPAYGAIPILNPELLPDDGLADGQGGGGPVDEDSTDKATVDAAGEVYTVQAGDTILSIVDEQKVSLAALLRANPDLLAQMDLEPGMELILP